MGISCFMVTTAARSWCIPLAIRCFRRQTLPGDELVIASEDEEVEKLVPPDANIRFERTPNGISLGEKHNEAVRRCRYNWLAKWDDDDWHAPRRLALTMRHLRMSQLSIAGTTELLFHELCEPRRSFLYQYQGQRPWISGNALMFRREIWERHPFPDRASAVDTIFAFDTLSHTVAAIVRDPGMVVVLQHGQTTGRKTWNPRPPEYKPWTGALMGEDLPLYEEAFRARES